MIKMRRLRELVAMLFMLVAFLVGFWSLFFGSVVVTLLSGVILFGLLLWLYVEDLMRMQTARRHFAKKRGSRL